MLGDQDSAPAPATIQPVQPVEQRKFEREMHIQYFKRNLQMLPEPYTSNDTHRMTLAMFTLGGLELLGVLEETVSEDNRKDWIEWIYSQQRVPASDGSSHSHDALYGFGGGPFSGLPFQQHSEGIENLGCECGPNTTVHDTAHTTMTYTALAMLVLLGDDLSRVAKEPILRSLRKLQQPDGCFIPCITDYEQDMRFVYCAAAISYFLNDWSGFNRSTALHFIRSCQGYDHGISQNLHQESHGGSIYCGIATLGLMGEEALQDQKTMTRDVQGREDEVAFEERKSRAGFVDLEGTRRWCLQRQTTGFQGRVNKPTDTCYSFWIGGALKTIGSFELVDFDCNRGFLMETQHKFFGGFGKWVGTYPDAMHSYMGIASLALMGEPGIRPLDPLLNISERMKERLHTQTVFWKDAA
ncbi:terpenoid cyclases/protein prenyltransferase alpha-alpha toroid [Gamsiella multidivaricata]|uniref:terpenoid cyclases/protein prenyltransferase alpha-alpha toroid n=1 Tax=Gamsiella multidivaricata TaxID=101098 RepID=UPI00221FCDCF|nr:terpenoid cyclases/protein prenyltransferase alpha-alpha toroid [Gamsiella multidivaricata]KAG0361885.1 Geranylgeranyl transferase type-1 subunit beta [Gamsiella multidivaricata]KAI7818605.1 terpenoid cyclases/protein prenyltransferase alpha-alpha toroid [Gamsiella multidivaricata]